MCSCSCYQRSPRRCRNERWKLSSDSCSVVVCVCFFFFQAEDGIRDVAVTGVQTCALPIFVEEPLATTSIVPMFYLSRLAASRVKVVLSGQGADEAMGGYRRYLGELLRRFVSVRAFPTLTRTARLLGVRNGAVWRGLASAGEQDDLRRFLNVYTVFPPDQIRRLTGLEERLATERIGYFFKLLLCSRQRHPAVRMMSLDLRMNLADDLLLYTDKITMHHSLECRVPLLDLDLVRYAEGLPCGYRRGLLHGKLLHRQFARQVLPGPILRRKKKRFLSPTKRWFHETTVIRDTLL